MDDLGGFPHSFWFNTHSNMGMSFHSSHRYVIVYQRVGELEDSLRFFLLLEGSVFFFLRRGLPPLLHLSLMIPGIWQRPRKVYPVLF